MPMISAHGALKVYWNTPEIHAFSFRQGLTAAVAERLPVL